MQRVFDLQGTWPDLTQPNTELDPSQITALKRILQTELAIIQGPPGTGKSYVSTQAIKVILDNHKRFDAPVIITAQTNHAVDQLLRHVNEFEPLFVRLGGRTKDSLVVFPRTLQALRQRGISKQHRKNNPRVGATEKAQDEKTRTFRKLFAPLLDKNEERRDRGGTATEIVQGPLQPQDFHFYGLINDDQLATLKRAESRFVGGHQAAPNDHMGVYCEDVIKPADIGRRTGQGLQRIEEEQYMGEDDDELPLLDDETDMGVVRGTYIPLFRGYTNSGIQLPDHKVQSLLAEYSENMHGRSMLKILPYQRGAIYDYLQKLLFAEINHHLRGLAERYVTQAQEHLTCRLELDYELLRETRVIGLTTTGLSKFRALVAALGPKFVLIEEAAETYEGNVTPACFPSLQQLVLVGDHKQLRPRIQSPELRDTNLDLSMFERLINNNLEYSRLHVQRRMIPEIRELISTIYPGLEDHPCTETRSDVKGMSGINSFWLNHQAEDATNDAMSKHNEIEADWIVEFLNYLILSGNPKEKITILTFYRGQCRKIYDKINKDPKFKGNRHVDVRTVDSYQGEENDIVILSLVRSNPYGQIGFVGDVNRACVALSRARNGFYIFGDAINLWQSQATLWREAIDQLYVNGRLLAFLPLTCERHEFVTKIHSEFLLPVN